MELKGNVRIELPEKSIITFNEKGEAVIHYDGTINVSAEGVAIPDGVRLIHKLPEEK
jgi:hypothetical protein